MAISKLKPRKISDGKSIRQYLADRIDYGKNPDKTDGGRLVSTYQCSPETAAEEFTISKKLYANLTGRSQPKERDVLSYFLLQSFRPGEITPEQAHQMGYQLALEFTGIMRLWSRPILIGSISIPISSLTAPILNVPESFAT